ncbi:Ig-like domain-containing protein, partial [Clostridium botulinum]
KKTEKIAIEGGSKSESNKDVDVVVTNNVKWTFKEAINQDDVTKENFIVKKKNGEKIQGNVTIDETKKIVTFVPTSIEKSSTYIAEAKAINKQDSGKTEAISVEFSTK